MRKIRYLALFSAVLMLLGCPSKKKEDSPSEIAKKDILKSDRVLRIAYDGKLLDDPLMSNNYYKGSPETLIYESLLEYDANKRPFELVPVMLTEMPRVENQHKKFFFTLKKGIQLKNGTTKVRELKSHDILESLERHLRSRETFWVFDNVLVGLDNWIKQKGALKRPKGFRRINDYQFSVEFTRSYPQFLEILAMPYMAITLPYDGKLLSTGPYDFIEKSNGVIALQRDDSHHMVTKNAEGEVLTPYSKKVLFQTKESLGNPLEALSNRKIDVLQLGEDEIKEVLDVNSSSSQANISLEAEYKKYSLQKSVNQDVVFMGFYLKNPKIKKYGVEFRKAVNHLINKNKIIRDIYDHQAIPAEFIVPPNLFGYDPDFKSKDSDYSVEKAKKIISKLKGIGDEEFEIDAVEGDTSEELSKLMADEMSQAGLKVKVNLISFPELISKLSAGRSQMWFLSWVGDYPDAENYLSILHSTLKPTTENTLAPNASHFELPIYDFLYDKLRTVPGGSEKLTLIEKMRNVFNDNLPILPIVHTSKLYLISDKATEYKSDTAWGEGYKWYR